MADDVGLPPLEGTLLGGRYQVDALIGRGGMAAVYQGRDTLLARPVALKVLVGPLAHDEAASQRFRAEARAAAAVSHPNVVAVYDVGEDGDWAFIVMELVRGESLAQRLLQGPLDPAVAAGIGVDVLSGLEAAHRSGLLHRDIKPGNVILTPEGTAKLADFGIAKAMKSVSTTTQPVSDPGMVLGTLSYLAPERLRGDPATVRSDLWSVGAVLYEALAGKAPFGLNRLAGTQGAPLDAPEESVQVARPGVGPELAGVIERAMAPVPEERFESAEEMREALAGAEAGGAALALPLDATQAITPVAAGLEPLVAADPVGAADHTLLLPVGGVGAAGAAGAAAFGGAEVVEARHPVPPAGMHEGRAWLLVPLALVVLLLVGLGWLLTSHGSPSRPPAGPGTTVVHKDKPPRSTTTTSSSTTTTSTSTTSSTTSTTTTVPPTTTSSTTTTTSTIPITTSTSILPTTTTTTTTSTSTTTTTTVPPSDATTTTTAGGGG